MAEMTLTYPAKRGDIQVLLTSPLGTVSTLLPFRDMDYSTVGYDEWPFMSVHFWGEKPFGNWTLQVDFRSSTGRVFVRLNEFHLYGTTHTPDAVARVPTQCDSACAQRCSAPGPQFCDACKNYRNASTQTCLTECGQGLSEYRGYCVDHPTASNMVCSSLSVVMVVMVGLGSLFCLVCCIVTMCVLIICCVRSAKKKRHRQLVSCEEDEDFMDYVPAV